MKPPPPEPAIKSYFFGKGYRDLRATITDSWRGNWIVAADYLRRAEIAFRKDMPDKLLAALWGGGAIAVVLFGTAFFLVLSTIHIIILLSFFATIYVLFTLAWLADRTFLLLRGFFAVCPSCHTRVPLPAYVCDGCGRLHYRLSPSSYGILKHQCTCGRRLPAAFFVSRGRLESKCPACTHPLTREHTESRKLFIPIVGGPSAGKSAYMAWLVESLRTRHGPDAGLTVSFLEDSVRLQVDGMIASMRKGKMPRKTERMVPHAVNLLFTIGGKPHRTLYLYDSAGEAYRLSGELIPHRFLEYMTGVLLLIDPFSIPRVRDHYGDRLKHHAEIQPSTLQPEDALHSLLLAMEAHFRLGKTRRLKIPLAVVLTKIDAFDLEDKLGERMLGGSGLDEEKRSCLRDRMITQQLKEWGQANLVQTINSRFATVRYFSCSAVGETYGVMRPLRIDAPLLWLVENSDKSFLQPKLK